MSTMKDNITAHIDCMIFCGFPGIGKTSTYKEMKTNFIGAKVVDMDVRDYGSTNGIDVADPAAYVREMEMHAKANACIFTTIDSKVRECMRAAKLFYVVVSPDFPAELRQHIPNHHTDELLKSRYMKRFTDSIGYNSLAANTLNGRGFDEAINEIFRDPMPHIVAEFINRDIVSNIWQQIEQMSRTTIQPNQLGAMMGAQPNPPMPGMMPPNFK